MKRLLCAILVLVCACGGEANNGTEGAEIAEEYQQVIDSAAEVEETLEDAKDRIDEAVDDIDGQD